MNWLQLYRFYPLLIRMGNLRQWSQALTMEWQIFTMRYVWTGSREDTKCELQVRGEGRRRRADDWSWRDMREGGRTYLSWGRVGEGKSYLSIVRGNGAVFQCGKLLEMVCNWLGQMCSGKFEVTNDLFLLITDPRET